MIPAVASIMLGAAVSLLTIALWRHLRRRWGRDVAWLQHAVWRFTPETFNAGAYVAAYYGLIIGLPIVCLLAPARIATFILWVVILIMPRIVFAIAWRRRRAVIEKQLPQAVRRMSASVASGMTLVQAIEQLAVRAKTPIRTEFRVMANLWNLGADFSAVIEEARHRLDLQDFNLFASAILVNQRMGGNVTMTLDQLATALEQNAQMRERIRSETSEGRMNVKVLMLTPLVMLGFVAVVDRTAVGLLFTTPVGLVLAGLAGAMSLGGWIWAWRIVNADL